MFRVLAALAALFALSTTSAAADDSALNREGYWTVGRGQADNDTCFASLGAKTGEMFLLQADNGEISFGVTAKRPIRTGKKGILTTEAYSFEFEPSFADGNRLVGSDEILNERVLAALRLARGLGVTVDGREVFNANVEGTGLEGALEAVLACSKGKSGWWGPGVGAEKLADGPVPNKSADGVVYNKEGVWAIAVGSDPGICVAQAKVDEHRHLQVLAAAGQMGLAVGTDGADLPRGKKGRLETDAYRVDFKPEYGADSYMASAEPLGSAAIAALAQARWVRVTVDGRTLVDASLEDSGFSDLLQSVAACSRGEKGWWGEGAKPLS